MSRLFFMSVLLASTSYSSVVPAAVRMEDIFVPTNCEHIPEQGDHLLIDYKFIFSNGSVGASATIPNQLFHLQLGNLDDLPITKGLKGMCKNSTRDLIWSSALGANFAPFIPYDSVHSRSDEAVTVRIHLNYITEQQDFLIFDALRSDEISKVLDMIEVHRGVNAVDEWGQSSLMIALASQKYPVVAALMNTRRPMVDFNLVKSSGFTALFYAVEYSPLSIVQALLRRGADPNSQAHQEGSKGNTPLHFACLLEKSQIAEALLEYGANPFSANEHGLTPFQLIPQDSLRSIKLYFQKIFTEAAEKLKSQIEPNSMSKEL